MPISNNYLLVATSYPEHTCRTCDFVILATSYKYYTLSSLDLLFLATLSRLSLSVCYAMLMRCNNSWNSCPGLLTLRLTKYISLFLVDQGVIPTTNMAIVPLCGYELPIAHMSGTCDFVITWFTFVGTLSLRVCYARLMRPIRSKQLSMAANT